MAGVEADKIKVALELCAQNLPAQMIMPSMPLQDAIDLAEFLIQTINYVKYTPPGHKTVGGPIEIAAITKHEGFKWINRKLYFNGRGIRFMGGYREFTKESEVPEYLEWRKQNQKGFVLNINTWSPKARSTKNVIHSAEWCRSLDAPPPKNRDKPITPEHPKLCSTDIQDLIDVMESKGLPYKRCGLGCLES